MNKKRIFGIAYHTAIILNIIILIPLCIISFNYVKDTTLGLYQPITNKIVAYPNHSQSLAENIRTLSHELCHFVWDEKLDNEQRESYNELYANTETYISWYAEEKGAKEDFADSCSFYILYKDDAHIFKSIFKEKKLDAERYEWLEKNIKKWL